MPGRTKDYSIYVLELAPELVPESKREVDAVGYLYVGWTAKSVEERRVQHSSGGRSAGAIFKRVVRQLGRALTEDELFLRPDLVTESPRWPAEKSANRAERRQANRLRVRGYVILSSHKHGIKA